MSSRWLQLSRYSLLFLFSTYLLGLFFTHKLTFYINANYEWFTATLTSICFCLSSWGCIRTIWLMVYRDASLHTHQQARLNPLNLLVIAILLCAFSIPPSTLSSHTAAQRSQSTPTAIQAQTTDSLLFNADSTQLTIKDWSTAIQNAPQPLAYVGKRVKVVGFVYAGTQSIIDSFYVTRFVITCCAIDAQPVSLPVSYPDWQKKLRADAWVQVTGSWVDNAGNLVIKPDTVTIVPAPENPYES